MIALSCASKVKPKEPDPTDLEIEADPVCFPFATGDAAMALDVAGNYKIAADAGHKLRAALATSRDLVALAKSIENELKTACTALDAALGATKKEKSADGLCNAAVAAMNSSRAKLGAKAKYRVIARAPTCGTAPAVAAECAAACDGPVDAKVTCEGTLVGTCGAACEGPCERKAAATCDGECVGSCEGGAMSGACAGVCKGTCDGKPSKGACVGACEGKCDAMSRGPCRGKCNGVCTPKAAGACAGTCAGKCAADMADGKCAGEVSSSASADCKSRCAAVAMSKMECHGGRVGLAIAGVPAANAKAAAHYRAAIEGNMGPIHKIASLGDRTKRVAAEGRTEIEGARGNLEAIAHTTRDRAHADNVTKAMTSCFADALKSGTEAADAIKAHVEAAESALGAVAATPAAAPPATSR